MSIVADASPLRYLVLIEEVELVPAIFGSVYVPPAVVNELSQPQTPEMVKGWARARPAWLHVQAPSKAPLDFPPVLGAAEREAISLAAEFHAGFLLIDDWAGRREAERRGLTVQGTLGILRFASRHGLTSLPDALSRLRETNFRASDELIQSLIQEEAERKRR
jgi:predicted nucleic acid-binding protein